MEEYWYIERSGEVDKINYWDESMFDKENRSAFGVWKTKEEAIERLKENPLDRERWIEAGKAMGWSYAELNEDSWLYYWHRYRKAG